MRFIDARQVHQACDYLALTDALQRFHAEDPAAIDDILLTESSGSSTVTHFIARAAWQRDRAAGIKLVTVFPDNPMDTPELPAVQAVFVLFDGRDGRPQAIIDGTALAYRKTAADSALGSRLLSSPDVKTLLMVGAGGLAPHLVRAHLAVRPSIAKVLLWNRTRWRAVSVSESLAEDGVEISVVDDLASAARESQLICCATMATEPLIYGEWLQPGAHLDLVGAFTSTMREADDEALRRASIFVDSRETTVPIIGELVIPLANGVITESDVLADHYDLIRNYHPGRQSNDEVTLFKNGGGGHLDLMTARFILEQTSGEADC